jgi:hypothetical protein
MANSAFWRELGDQFRKLQGDRFSVGNVNASEPGTLLEYLMTPGAVESLIRQGAAELATADSPDLVGVWFQALNERGISIPMSGQRFEPATLGAAARSIENGYVDGLCEASTSLCERLEAEDMQAEEKQRSDYRGLFRPFSERLKRADSETNPP